MVPRLSARCVNIRLGPIPARVVQAPYHDVHDTCRCGRLAEQPGATGWAETTLYDTAAIPGHIIVFHLPVDANCTGRDKQRSNIQKHFRPLVGLADRNSFTSGARDRIEDRQHTAGCSSIRNQITSRFDRCFTFIDHCLPFSSSAMSGQIL